jgi:P4 family phage/plasmid primase-like protien
MEGMSTLRKEFISGLLPYYYTYYDMCSQIGDEEYLSYASIVSEIVVKLKTTGYTDSLMRQVIHYFKYNNFIEELDKYRHILCFGEYVYDLKINEWRKTTKEDMCSKKCGLTKDEVSDKYINDLLEVLEDIHPDPERRQFFINSLSDLLYGKNTKEIFHIWTGAGRNGKGVVSDIIKYCFGDYYYSPSVSYITQKRASSTSADPQMAKARGVRVVVFGEPEENARLNNSIIKQLTGGDELCVRNLFESPFTFTPHFTPIIQCNTFQLQDVKDDSIPDRLLFMKFKTSFVDNPTMDWQRLKDPTLKDEENMQKLKGAMMWLLLETWRNLTPEQHAFDTPQSVIDDKNEFLDENNNVKQFVAERIEFTKEKTDFLSAKDLLAMYRDFMEERNERTGKLTLSGFITRIRKYMGEFVERYQPKGEDGKQHNYRRVFLYCKEQQDE